MFLKNYTSNVPVSQTIYRIEQVLIKCGVSGIMKEYGSKEGDVVAVTFKIQTGDTPALTIRLPVNVDQAHTALWLNYVDGDKLSPDGNSIAWGSGNKRKTKASFKDQADRTAWKIIQDWVEVQMSMIQLNQADFREVFLPYVWDGRQTVYQRIAESGFKGLLLTNGE